jgi:lipopolysaccharide export system protein LptC
MAWGDNFYSRLVAWMKILLPLAALGLLSTLFLISRTIDPTAPMPLTAIDLEQRAQDLGATRPAFAGVTRGGDEIRLQATRARPDPDNPRTLLAEDIRAELRLTEGTIVDIAARSATVDQRRSSARLFGEVRLTTTTGYDITTEALEARFDQLRAETPGAVRGTGPAGELTAGRMILEGNDEDGSAHLLFTDGVKLLYTPKTSED